MLSVSNYIIAGVLVVGGFFTWKYEHDKRIREKAAASARFERDSVTLISFRDSLGKARVRAETSTVNVRRTIVTYDTARKRVVITDTSRYVVVDTTFLRSADSLRLACSILESDCAVYRKWADSTITTLERQVVDATERACPVMTFPIEQKAKWAGIGGVVVYVGTKVYDAVKK